MQAATSAPAFADTDPPLWDGLGAVSYKITTSNPAAQTYFDQGLRLTYAFNHGEAQRAFRKAQKLDPACAMCFWGEALVLGPNINLPMQDEAVAPAFAAAQKARALAAKASPREQALIAAVAARYAEDPKADRKPLDAAYAGAMGQVAAEFPEDNEIAVLYAESVMDLSPWNYWQPGGREPNPQSVAIVPTLERVLAKDPNHPGAIHYYIHAVEASDRPERAEPHADRLRGALPGAGHLVHMPSHIYYRVGRYLDALSDNKTAVAVDERYLAATAAPMAVYRLGYYPHNVHFVIASAQMAGDGPVVIAAAEKLRGLIPDEIARGIAMTQPVKAAPYFAHAQFSPPDTILALPDPGDAIPYVKAMWHYARGIADAASGDFAAADAEANAIEALERTADFALLKTAGVPAQDVLKLARALVQGRVAQARGDTKTAIARFEEAAALQDGWCRRADSMRRRISSGALSNARRTTDGPIMGSPSFTGHAATPTQPARRKRSSRRPGSATAHCCNCPSCSPDGAKQPCGLNRGSTTRPLGLTQAPATGAACTREPFLRIVDLRAPRRNIRRMTSCRKSESRSYR